jgi:multiple sugar transport system permease protein
MQKGVNPAVVSRERRRKGTGRIVGEYLFLAPAMIILIGLVVFPMIWALRSSLFNFQYGKATDFVGLSNYWILLKSSLFWDSLRVTTVLTVGSVAAEFVLGFALALLLSEELGRLRGVFRALIMIPMFIAPIVVGIIWRMMFNPQYGVIDYIFHAQGFSWTGSTTWAIPSLIVADVWEWTPFMFVILLASIEAMPLEQMDAAVVDGCNYLQKVRYIILPSIKMGIVVAVLLRLMDAIKMFDSIWTLTWGGPGRTTESATYSIYRYAFNDFRMGIATAFSWIFVILLTIFVTIFLRQVSRRFNIL